MKTRFLADSLALPPTWNAERYSTTIRLIGPNGLKADLVLPYGTPDVAEMKRKAAAAIAEAEGRA